MASTIVTKNSTTAASAPTISDIIQGELASNLTDGFLFSRDEANNIVSFGVIKQGASSTETPRFDGTNWLPSAALLNDGTDITVAANLTTATFTLGATLLTVTGAELNTLDGITADVNELNILDGVTATAAELNILDGVTATFAELNILDGVTATTAELNYVDGVTSAIQTQMDLKAPIASPTFTGQVVAPAYTESNYSVTGTTPALDPANGGLQYWTLTANSTPTFSLANGESFSIQILDGTAYTITWPTMKWIGGAAPTLDTTNPTHVEIWQVNSVVYGALVGVSS